MAKSVELLEKTLQVFRLKKDVLISKAKSEALKEEAENLMMLGVIIPESEVEAHDLIFKRLEEIKDDMRELRDLADVRVGETKELKHEIDLEKMIRNICNN